MSRVTVLIIILSLFLGLRMAYDFLAPDEEPVPLRIPFSELPGGLLGPDWEEKKSSLAEETLRVSRVSDYVQRRYRKGEDQFWFYVGYVEKWDPRAIHPPERCFPAVGLQPEGREVVPISIPGIGEAVRFNEIHWRDDLGARTYTLFSFFYNGKFEPSETKMQAEHRVLIVRYFAIVTLSGPIKGSLEETREAYRDVAGRLLSSILPHLPES